MLMRNHLHMRGPKFEVNAAGIYAINAAVITLLFLPLLAYLLKHHRWIIGLVAAMGLAIFQK